jgi:putative ABC transport system substrate-binding protein
MDCALWRNAATAKSISALPCYGSRLGTDSMNRREFAKLFGGSVAAWPLTAQAQKLPVIGFLNGGDPGAFVDRLAGFHDGLREAGFVDKQNVAIEYRWAKGQLGRLPALAAELVDLPVNVIAATGNLASGVAAKAVTTTIPIVFISGPDPVKAGLVAGLNRPGGNATGVFTSNDVIGAKRLQIIRDLVPATGKIAMLENPTAPGSDTEAQSMRATASAAGVQFITLEASTRAAVEQAFATIGRERAGALIVPADPFLTNERDHIIALAARHRVPTIYNDRVFGVAGGLLSYGPSLPEGYRQVGRYVGMILKGAKPADLPVVQPTKFELVINRKTAATLSLAIPDRLLAIADEVID